MRVRTRYQKQVVELANGLKPATKKHVDWAYRECLDHYAFRTKSGRTTCLDCGHQWTIARDKEKYCQCPKCKAKLTVENTMRRKARSSSYFSVAETKGGLQVLRIFLLETFYEKGKAARIWHTEIAQYWMNEKGKCALIGRKRTLGRYQDSFIYSSPMEPRKDNDVYRYIATCPIHPDIKVIPQLTRNGFEGDFFGIAPLPLFTALLSDSRIETLIKEKRITELRHFMQHPKALDLCWKPYLIAKRRHYDIADITMWCDLINLLDKQGKDLRNPHFICPTDLKAARDKWLNTWKRKQERQREEEQRQWQLEREERELQRLAQMGETKEKYLKEKAPYLNITLTDGLVTLHVLRDVDEFYEEGKALSHCVFACSYFDKESSVILSARVKGERMETVELSLKSLSVVQCHGKYNHDTEYHERIINLVNSNTDMFRKCMMSA